MHLQYVSFFAVAALASVSAFAPAPSFRPRTGGLRMSSTESVVPIIITGNNIDVTPALSDYVNKKLSNTVGKLTSTGIVLDCDVHLSVNKNPKVSEDRCRHVRPITHPPYKATHFVGTGGTVRTVMPKIARDPGHVRYPGSPTA
eukprot:scaffold31041_cov56-Attheya_sp.AAC.11